MPIRVGRCSGGLRHDPRGRLLRLGKPLCHNSCSASSRNSSGTTCPDPSTTEPYPIADQPNRSRIVSTARSAAQRISLLSLPPRQLPSTASGRASCSTASLVRCDTRIPSSDILGLCRYCARTARTSRSATPARAADVGIGVSNVTERVTARKSAKRTRTVTVRPNNDLARNRALILSARCRRAGRKTLSCAG
jgi:hypothetical protein